MFQATGTSNYRCNGTLSKDSQHHTTIKQESELSEVKVKLEPDIKDPCAGGFIPKGITTGRVRRRSPLLVDCCNHYQQHWFSASLEQLKFEERSREERLEITRHELVRHLRQLKRSNVGKSNGNHSMEEVLTKSRGRWEFMGAGGGEKFSVGRRKNCSSRTIEKNGVPVHHGLVPPRLCDLPDCGQPALPCTRHCSLHIMLNTDQLLFGQCTAKFADNTQCSVPVFDIIHELPLCAEHARKCDNYQLQLQEAQQRPKKLRKKVKPSAMIRPQKRTKKRKKPPPLPLSMQPTLPASSSSFSSARPHAHVPKPIVLSSNSTSIMPATSSAHYQSSIQSDFMPTTLASQSTTNNIVMIDNNPLSSAITTMPVPTSHGHLGTSKSIHMKDCTDTDSSYLEEDMVGQVLDLNEGDGFEQVLQTQASHLLEESDINTVLSTIQVDEFSDFFAVNRNGEYEPSREEAEELEKALAAVDNDVKSLEKLSQTAGLLDALLDDTLEQTLVQIPDMFHNGYANMNGIGGDSIGSTGGVSNGIIIASASSSSSSACGSDSGSYMVPHATSSNFLLPINSHTNS